MRLVFGFVLIVGLALAGAAAWMAQDYINQQKAALAAARAQTAPEVPTLRVMTANKQLRFGQTLTREDVAAVTWPASAVPEGVFTEVEALFPANAEPRRVLRALEPGEPLMAIKLTEPGADAGITSRLTPGMRAFTIKVDATTGVSGFLRPGDRVDVYWSGRTAATGDVTKLIETGLALVAVDQSADMDRTTAVQVARTVTVEATPQQVASLTQAQSTGRLTLALVGAEDTSIASAIEVDQRLLLGIEDAPQAVEAAPEPVCTVRTRRGAEVFDMPIPCTN